KKRNAFLRLVPGFFAMFLILPKINASAGTLAASSHPNSNGLEVGCGGFATALISLHIERKLLALVEIVHASTLHCRDVNKHIRAAIILHDETKTLLGVEKLNGTCGHHGLLIKTRKGVVCPIQHSHGGSYPDFACSRGKAIKAQGQGQA